MSFDVRLPTLRKEREGWGSQGELRRSNGWASPPIVDLVEAFERNLDSYRSSAYKEAEVRREFIDPFFDGRVGRVARLFVDEFTSEFKAGAPSLRSLQGRGFWLCPVSPLEVGGGPLV